MFSDNGVGCTCQVISSWNGICFTGKSGTDHFAYELQEIPCHIVTTSDFFELVSVAVLLFQAWRQPVFVSQARESLS